MACPSAQTETSTTLYKHKMRDLFVLKAFPSLSAGIQNALTLISTPGPTLPHKVRRGLTFASWPA